MAANARPEDVAEMKAEYGDDVSMLSILRTAYAVSDNPRTLVHPKTGEALAILGVRDASLLGGVSVPWMLGTPVLETLPLHFLVGGVSYVREIRKHHRFLQNFVHVDNTTTINWLKRIGFEFDEAKPHGVKGELFYRFYVEGTHN